MLVEERKKIILEKLKINSMVTLTELIDDTVTGKKPRHRKKRKRKSRRKRRPPVSV